jgi:molecular chaperone DnaJ
MELHPDRHGGDKEKEAEFKRINEAYATLSDSQKRAHYDRF